MMRALLPDLFFTGSAESLYPAGSSDIDKLIECVNLQIDFTNIIEQNDYAIQWWSAEEALEYGIADPFTAFASSTLARNELADWGWGQ